MRYFAKVGLFGKKSSDLTNSIFDGPFILAYGVLAYHQGHFNIPYAFPGLNNSGSVLYGDATGDDTPRIVSEASFTPSMPMAEFSVQSHEGAVSALVTMLTRPYTMNSDLLPVIVEFKGFGFVGMAFCRLALGISGAVTTCCGASSSRIAPKFSADGRRMYPNLLGDFF